MGYVPARTVIFFSAVIPSIHFDFKKRRGLHALALDGFLQ
jgi:hypothetical protein